MSGAPNVVASLRARRALDVLLAGAGLVAGAPVLAVAAAAIKLEGPGPVLFRQERLGQGMRPFTLLKLRTMTPDAPSEAHEAFIAHLAAARPREALGPNRLQKLTEDPRVTPVGRWLRRLSIDELPQLVNVLAGEMALVGPRPALPYELAHYDPHHYERFAVPPGLTGLWQVSGRSRLGFREMLDLDVRYVRARSLALDLRILVKTPAALVGRTA